MRKALFAVGALFSLAIAAQLSGVSFAAANPPALGGTGTTAVPSSGQVLIGNASGTYTPGLITCTGNCTTATSSGGFTINVTGGGGAITIAPVSQATTSFAIVGDGTFFKVTNPSTSTIL